MVIKSNSSAIMLITGKTGGERTAHFTFCNFIFLTPKYLFLSFVKLEMNCMH